MNKLSGPTYWAIKNKALVWLVIIMFFIVGIMSYLTLPKQEYPVVQMPIAVITAVYPGAAPSDMEELVTKKIEETVMQADGYDSCSSQSMSGVSVVSVNFDANLKEEDLSKNIDTLRNKINDLRDRLPSGVTSLNYNTDALESADMVVAVTGDGRTNEELGERAKKLKDQLTGLNGVNKVTVEGDIQRKVNVTVNTDKLAKTGLSMANVVSVIGAQNNMLPIGSVEMPDSRLTVTTSGKFQNLDEIRKIVIQVSPSTGAAVTLGDIADVSLCGDKDEKHYAYNGKDAVLVDLCFKKGVNMLSVSKGVQTSLDKYSSTLPEGVKLNMVSYLPDEVKLSVNSFVRSLVESVLIVVGVIMLGMSLRNGVIISLAIPLCIMVTFASMNLFKVDIQFISLSSLIIALGMLVDDAVVVCDEIQVRIDRGEEKLAACVNGAKTVALPVLTSTGTTVSTFIMFLLLPGIMGKFSFSLPVICCTALIASYIISMLVTPLMCYLFMKKTPDSKRKSENQEGSWLIHPLDVAFRHKGMTLCITGCVLVASAFLLMHLNFAMLPSSTKTVLDISLTTSDMNDVRKTEKAVKTLEQVLSEQPETEYYLTSVAGRVPKYDFSSQPTTDAKNMGSAFLRINLKKGGRYQDKMIYLEHLQGELNERIPGCRVVVKELGVMPTSSNDIELHLTGDDVNKLNAAADTAVAKLRQMGGTRNIYASKISKSYDYYVNTRNDILNSYGLTKSEVQNELSIALMGRDATTYRSEGKEYPVTVKSNIASLPQMERFGIKSSIGGRYQLGQLADVGLKEDYSTISRFEGKRVVTVTADANTGNSPITLQSNLQKYMESQNLHDVNISAEGLGKSFSDSMTAFASEALISILLIFMILYLEFGSFRNTFVVLCTVPMTIIGSSIGLAVFRQDLSLFAVMGIISLIGVVVKNAILLVDYIKLAREDGMELEEACKSAVLRRVRPIFLTTITAVLGMVPLAVSEKDILFRGLAIAFMFGLFVCMLTTLIVIPVIYYLLEVRGEKKRLEQLESQQKEEAVI